jgi:L-ascorbate metabolism protein UlaG (beta-lactamase superfamily)
MRFTHLGHACVLLETDTTRVLLDPGNFSAGFEKLTDLDAVLVTHQHPDHLDPTKLPALMDANPRAELIIDEGGAAVAEKLRLAPRVVRPGERLTIGKLAVNVVGGTHATIHPDIPLIPNAGYVFDDGAFYHPGDALFVPEQQIDVLAAPAMAPWMSISAAVDYYRQVNPRVAVPIHQALLANTDIYYGLLDTLKPSGSTFTVLPPEVPVEL